MAAVAIAGVFAWGCLGVARGMRYHHLAIFFAFAASIAGIGSGQEARRSKAAPRP
jgi:hypothetical protein